MAAPTVVIRTPISSGLDPPNSLSFPLQVPPCRNCRRLAPSQSASRARLGSRDFRELGHDGDDLCFDLDFGRRSRGSRSRSVHKGRKVVATRVVRNLTEPSQRAHETLRRDPTRERNVGLEH